jgi:putative flippase GtrA
MPSSSRTAELWRIARFGAVGLFSSGLYLAIFAVLITRTEAVPASILAYVLSAGLNFLLQSTFTFGRSPLNAGNALRFVAMHLVCAATNTGLVWLLTEVAQFPVMVTQAAIVVFIAGLSYVISRFWVYAEGTPGRR